MKNKLIILSADAFVTEDLDLLSTLPGYKKYMKNASMVRNVRSIYPTVTFPCHVTMMTGTYPNKHGVTSNFPFVMNESPMPWNWYADIIRSKDIFTACKEKGLTTATVFWPVTCNHKDIDYMIPEFNKPMPVEMLEEAFTKVGCDEDMLAIIKKNLVFLEEFRHPYTDEFIIHCACDILRQKQPDVLLIHPGNIDAARHAHGVFNEKVNKEIRSTDRFIQMLMGVQEELGLAENTNFVLTSDHGQMDIQRIMNLNVMLAEYGFIDVDSEGMITDWRAYCHSNGLSALIYLKNPHDEAVKNRVFQLLRWMKKEGVYGISEVFTTEDMNEKYALDGDFSFVVESDGYTSFGAGVKVPLVQTFGDMDYRYGRASHGYLPEKGPQPVFVVKGPAFAENVIIEQAELVDEAPTYARILGVELPDADGSPIIDLLKKENLGEAES